MEAKSSPRIGDYHRRDTCRACHSDRLASFLDYGLVPLAGDFITPSQVGSESVYPMDLAYCADCSLVQIVNVVAADELFTDYRYLSSVTETLINHFKAYASLLKKSLTNHDSLVVEFGCNDGVLLEPLKNLGVRSVGVDAAENVVELTRSKDLEVEHGYFGETLARTIEEKHGKAQIITASNVFAHIDDLDNVMRGVQSLLTQDGTFIVEVHYVLDLIETVQFDTVYHEHLCYYSLKALDSLYKRFGLVIADAERLPMHGGAIRVFARRGDSATVRQSDRLTKMIAREEAAGLYSLDTYRDFGTSTHKHREDIREFVLRRKESGRSLCGYGAAGRATTLLNYCGLDHRVLDYIVDESPSRIDRYVPGVRIPILPRGHFHSNPSDDCVLTAWNYREEIVSKESAFLEDGGAFLAPLPEIEVITGGTPCLISA